MKMRHRVIIGSLVLSLAMLSLISCTSYGYFLVTYNETTAKIREHEILGTVHVEVHATAEMWKEDKGIRALLLDAARDQYGASVDDVVNVATSQSAGWAPGYIFVQGDAIAYTGGGS